MMFSMFAENPDRSCPAQRTEFGCFESDSSAHRRRTASSVASEAPGTLGGSGPKPGFKRSNTSSAGSPWDKLCKWDAAVCELVDMNAHCAGKLPTNKARNHHRPHARV